MSAPVPKREHQWQPLPGSTSDEKCHQCDTMRVRQASRWLYFMRARPGFLAFIQPPCGVPCDLCLLVGTAGQRRRKCLWCKDTGVVPVAAQSEKG